ncbi:MAG: hypothetical protein O7G85_16660 [Planctomycetota bacterium]|nr:hypothetical protein [Planctomycetota bacterium]
MTDETEQSFSWKAHPARERRAQATMAILVILLFCGFVFFSFSSLAWAALSFGVLLASLNRFFFPSRFTIDEEGISANYPLRNMRLPWTHLKRFVHDANGGYLSTRARPSRMDGFKGMHIIFDLQRDTIIEKINRHLAEVKRA